MLGREVDVDVRCAGHLLVQESLEQKVVLDGIHTRDSQHIGDDRVGGRSPTLARDSMLSGKAHEVPVDEEELRQACLLDHLELVLQPARDLRRDRTVALANAFEAQLVEIGERGLAGRHRVARKANLAKVEVEVAFLGDVPRRGQRRGMTFEQRPHLRATFQAVL